MSETLVQRTRRALLGIEELGRRDGVTWLCDVAATGADGIRAVGMRGGTVIVVTRGAAPAPPSSGSGGSWNEWAAMIATHASHVLLFGPAADTMAAALQARNAPTCIVRCADLEDAAQAAERIAAPGATIVLSTGCAQTALGADDAARFRGLLPVGLRPSGAWAAA